MAGVRAPRCCAGGVARTPPTSTPPPPDRPGPAGRPVALRRSAPRPARAVLCLLEQRPRGVEVHRELADLALGLVKRDPRPAATSPLGPRARRPGTPQPRGDPPRWLPGVARQQIERFTAQQAQDHPPCTARFQRVCRHPSGDASPRWSPGSLCSSIPASMTPDIVTASSNRAPGRNRVRGVPSLP